MGRAPCCSKVGLRRGPWTLNEDNLLVHYIQTHGEGHWRSLPKKAGLLRCGKSCRLRWMNYLRPDIKRGNITPDEEDLIIRMHSLLGNRWSLIAGRLPGRTDNEIKNYWNSHLSKRCDSDKSRRYSADKAVKGPKRRKSDATKVTKQTPKDPKNSRELTTKVKIHQPKAVRISASPSSMIRVDSNSSFNSRVVGDISVSSAANKGLSRTLNRIREDVANEYIEDMLMSLDCDILTSSNPCQDDNMDHLLLPDAPSNKEVLEKILEEYQGVLMAEDHAQLESFLDSLWI